MRFDKASAQKIFQIEAMIFCSEVIGRSQVSVEVRFFVESLKIRHIICDKQWGYASTF